MPILELSYRVTFQFFMFAGVAIDSAQLMQCKEPLVRRTEPKGGLRYKNVDSLPTSLYHLFSY